MTLEEYFLSLNLADWIIHSINRREGGQAELIEVRNKEKQIGFFRKLKSTLEIDIKRFQREVSVLTTDAFKSPYIVEILEHSRDTGQYWYISRKGNSFAKFWRSCKENAKSSDEAVLKAVEIIKKICQGLAPLHDAGIVHRDLKPDNIVEIDGDPVVIDFGVAFRSEDERLTDVDDAVGNRRYSPDQMMNRMEDVPPWLDVFMLSQLFIWMTSEGAVKNWTRPLDWRWVIYPPDASPDCITAARALTGSCSDQSLAPANARELLSLIDKLFTRGLEVGGISQEIEEIKRQGEATLLLKQAEKVLKFEAGYGFVAHLYNKIRSFLTALRKENSQHDLTYVFNELGLEVNVKSKHFARDFVDHPISVVARIGDAPAFHFSVTIAFQYFANSEHLPEGFIPFAVRLDRVSHDVSNYKPSKSLLVGIDKEYNLFLIESSHQLTHDKDLISIEDLLDQIKDLIFDPEAWKGLYPS